jgi:hypothetical protein
MSHIQKNEVARLILQNDIDICCIQEAEIPQNFPTNELSING